MRKKKLTRTQRRVLKMVVYADQNYHCHYVDRSQTRTVRVLEREGMVTAVYSPDYIVARATHKARGIAASLDWT